MQRKNKSNTRILREKPLNAKGKTTGPNLIQTSTINNNGLQHLSSLE